MIVSRIDVVRLDFTAVPLDTHIRTDGVHVSVSTLEEAATRAGFVPRLPSTDAVAGEAPALSVTSRFELTQTLRSADLRAALARWAHISRSRMPGTERGWRRPSVRW